MKIPLIVILGPTASGKTEIAINLARKFRGEIICSDSRTVYQDMVTGTASPIAKLKVKSKKLKVIAESKGTYKINGIRHHLLHFLKPDQDFSVAEFKKIADEKIKDIWSRGKIPFLVGGTPLYIDAVSEGLQIPKVSADKKLREKLEKKSNQELLQQLQKLDPITAARIDAKNKRRLVRALEVCLKTRQPFSKLRQKTVPAYEVLKLGINLPRNELYNRIDKRVEAMTPGLVKEVKKLRKKGYGKDLPAMSGIGYREIGDYLEKKLTLDEAKQKIKFRTHAFARHQLVWFRKDKKIIWVKNQKNAEEKIKKSLSRR